MKITKAMGRACLKAMGSDWLPDVRAVHVALKKIGWLDHTAPVPFLVDKDHLQTALAMCAAIAGVKP